MIIWWAQFSEVKWAIAYVNSSQNHKWHCSKTYSRIFCKPLQYAFHKCSIDFQRLCISVIYIYKLWQIYIISISDMTVTFKASNKFVNITFIQRKM